MFNLINVLAFRVNLFDCVSTLYTHLCCIQVLSNEDERTFVSDGICIDTTSELKKQ